MYTEYDDASWETPSVLGKNSAGSPWRTIPGIDSEAEWISLEPVFYCRHQIGHQIYSICKLVS